MFVSIQKSFIDVLIFKAIFILLFYYLYAVFIVEDTFDNVYKFTSTFVGYIFSCACNYFSATEEEVRKTYEYWDGKIAG